MLTLLFDLFLESFDLVMSLIYYFIWTNILYAPSNIKERWRFDKARPQSSNQTVTRVSHEVTNRTH